MPRGVRAGRGDASGTRSGAPVRRSGSATERVHSRDTASPLRADASCHDPAMQGPLLLGLVGTVVVACAAFLQFFVVRPERERYRSTGVKFNVVQSEGLSRLINDQGRISLLAFAGAALQVVGLLWQATRLG